MTKRQSIIHALMLIEMVGLNEDGNVYASHDELDIGGSEIYPDSEYGKILTRLGFNYRDGQGWSCFT